MFTVIRPKGTRPVPLRMQFISAGPIELRQRFADFDARGIVNVEQAGGDFSSIG